MGDVPPPPEETSPTLKPKPKVDLAIVIAVPILAVLIIACVVILIVICIQRHRWKNQRRQREELARTTSSDHTDHPLGITHTQASVTNIQMTVAGVDHNVPNHKTEPDHNASNIGSMPDHEVHSEASEEDNVRGGQPIASVTSHANGRHHEGSDGNIQASGLKHHNDESDRNIHAPVLDGDEKDNLQEKDMPIASSGDVAGVIKDTEPVYAVVSKPSSSSPITADALHEDSNIDNEHFGTGNYPVGVDSVAPSTGDIEQHDINDTEHPHSDV